MIEFADNPKVAFSRFAREWISLLYEFKIEDAIQALDEPNSFGNWPTADELRMAARLVPRVQPPPDHATAAVPWPYSLPGLTFKDELSESVSGSSYRLLYSMPGSRPSKQLTFEFAFRKRGDHFAVSFEGFRE